MNARHTFPVRFPSRLSGRGTGVAALAALALGLTGLAISPSAQSHGEQIAVGGGSKGPVKLTAAQQQTLGLQVAAAALRPVTEELFLNGSVQLPPDRVAAVATRISGQVTALYVAPGSDVRRGQRLARVQSRLVGDPPPSVDVLAPRDGVVDAVNVAVGQAVEPATTLMQLSDPSSVAVVARVYEEDLGKVHVGQAVAVHTLSYPGRRFDGRIARIGPVLDAQTRTVDVWIPLANADGALKPNLFARAAVALRAGTAVLAVPNAAVLEANGESFVFVRQGGAFARVDVHIGARDEDVTEITDGLVPGDEVVTQGNREVYTQWLTGGVLKQADADD